jgi:solute carrier family 39 (zinc transporter), member 7
MFTSSALTAALISTALISLAPNFILFAFPSLTNRDAVDRSLVLSLGQTLAAGGLLGDVFLHIMPEASKETDGLLLLLGFFIFLVMDVIVRSFDTEDGHSPSKHGDCHHTKVGTKRDSLLSTALSSSILLNLTADALHNFTDGLAIGSSFAVAGASHSSWSALLASRGGLATITILLHEIPHELGDYCVLLNSGFSKMEAIMAQFLTAIAAFLGTIVGLWASSSMPGITFVTGGGFVYIATVTILPKILEQQKASFRFRFLQLLAFLVGIGFLYLVTLIEEEHSHGHSNHHHEHQKDECHSLSHEHSGQHNHGASHSHGGHKHDDGPEL